jgi:hypothetical protein
MAVIRGSSPTSDGHTWEIAHNPGFPTRRGWLDHRSRLQQPVAPASGICYSWNVGCVICLALRCSVEHFVEEVEHGSP